MCLGLLGLFEGLGFRASFRWDSLLVGASRPFGACWAVLGLPGFLFGRFVFRMLFLNVLGLDPQFFLSCFIGFNCFCMCFLCSHYGVWHSFSWGVLYAPKEKETYKHRRQPTG